MKDPRNNPDLIQGKVPPQALDLEAGVIGAILLEKKAIDQVIEILPPEAFYHDAHQKIYQAALALFHESNPIDLLTVTQRMKQDGTLESVGGVYKLAKLTNSVVSSSNIQFHARIILQQYIKREIITVASKTISEAYEDGSDSLELLDNYQQKASQIEKLINIGSFASIQTEIKALIDRNEELLSKQGVSGVPSGFMALDRVTGGWQNSDFIIVAARPGMGKTSLALALARNAAVEFGIPTAVFSLEMSSQQLVARLAAMESEIDLENFMRKGLDQFQMTHFLNTVSPLAGSKIFIDDTSALSAFELKVKARKLKRDNKIGLIIVDYVQLMQSGLNLNSRENEISHISRSLKAIAKDLNIPVIALSQLSRECEKRADKIPMLSDLRESGSLEQDADLVSFIYRPEYYGIDEDEQGNSTHGKAMIMIAKHRNGAIDNVPLAFNGKLTKFADLEHKPTPINQLRNDNPDF
jgi:replicative DNA helicase